jgi:hypothetical protein
MPWVYEIRKIEFVKENTIKIYHNLIQAMTLHLIIRCLTLEILGGAVIVMVVW